MCLLESAIYRKKWAKTTCKMNSELKIKMQKERKKKSPKERKAIIPCEQLEQLEQLCSRSC